jgi:putative nucleotidyltransferase with HDIG domain
MLSVVDSRRLVPQPAIAVGTVFVALGVLGFLWLLVSIPSRSFDAERNTLLTLALVAGGLSTYHFPIHLRLSSKVYMSGVVFFLMSALLPIPLAVTAVGLTCLAGEISVRSRTGNYPSDIATVAARSIMVAAVTTSVAHLSVHVPGARPVVFIATAAAMWAMEHVTTPLMFYPLTGEHPVHIIRVMMKEGGLIEASQLLIALLGVIAAAQELWTLALLLVPTGLVYISFKKARELDDGTRKTLEAMADAVDLRDPYTGGHSRRVTEYVAGILHAFGKEGPEVDLVLWAARVHDIGKIAIPDGILNKTGPLTDEERIIMESHSDRGAEFLSRYPQFDRGVEIVRHHHERWDGAGYPYRLRETAIPFGSRVIAVADSYDAMTSDRPYRRGMSPACAAAILREGRGSQWEGVIVDAFIRSIAHQLDPGEGRPLHVVPSSDDLSASAMA